MRNFAIPRFIRLGKWIVLTTSFLNFLISEASVRSSFTVLQIRMTTYMRIDLATVSFG